MSENDSVYKILDNAARAWWYHRQLRERGEHEEARALERKSILGHVQTLRQCLENKGFATVGRGGWTIHYNKWGTLSHCYPGVDRPMIRCCLRLGIPVCDSTMLPGNLIGKVVGVPMASIDPDPEPVTGYHSFSYAPVEYVFRLYEELGATVYNLEVANDNHN